MIPKTIHQVIFGNTPTGLVKRCLVSWNVVKKLGFQIKIWDYRDVLSLINKKTPHYIEPFINSRNYGEAADIARYIIIGQHSGYYVDWDIELINPEKFLELSLSAPNGFLLVDPSNNTYAPELFSAIREDCFFNQLMNDILNVYKTQIDLPFTPQYTGPFRMRESMIACKNVIQKIIPVKNVFEYDYSEIRSASFENMTRPLVHHWIHSWIK